MNNVLITAAKVDQSRRSMFISVSSVSSKASGLHSVHPSTVEPFLSCQRPHGLHEESPVNVDGWYVIKPCSPNIYLQLSCSLYSKIKDTQIPISGFCVTSLRELSNDTTNQTVSMT